MLNKMMLYLLVAPPLGFVSILLTFLAIWKRHAPSMFLTPDQIWPDIILHGHTCSKMHKGYFSM